MINENINYLITVALSVSLSGCALQNNEIATGETINTQSSKTIIPALAEKKRTTLKGRYFGQKPPGLTPELFAPRIISLNGRFEGAVSFSPELDEIYFAAYNEGEDTAIYFSKLKGNEWTPIKKANFTQGKKKTEMHPFVSPDGKRIYFTAFDTVFEDERIWYINRFRDSWSDAKQLDSPINDGLVFAPNQAKNGDLFYTEVADKRKIMAKHAPNKKGEYPEVKEVVIDYGHHAFISPDQEYLLVVGRNKQDNRKDNDLYVYFKKINGTWSNPINLGPAVNSELDDKSPRITPDGQYLFFGRSERDVEPGLSNIYWVSTDVIQKVRPTDLNK